jgi:hypothetical protein
MNREKPWISHNFFTRLKHKRKLWLKFKRSYSESDYLVHRKYSNKLSHDLKKAKNNYENKLLEKDTKAVYKYINSKISSRVSTPRVIKDDGSLCNNNLETANILANFFESVYVILNFPSILIPNIVDSLDEIELNDSLLLEELSNIKLTSAPGPDNISGSTLKICAETLVLPLLHIMKLSFFSSTVPTEWLKASVTAIYKKGDKTLASNYRPISLTSICCKLMERIISKQLINFALKHNVIPSQQHGFLPGRSVVTCLLECVNDWTLEIDNFRPVNVLYLDFEKAFDRVPHQRLLVKLSHFGIRGHLLKWIQAFLSNRTFHVKVADSISDERQVVSGVPQGSVLGPLLFVIYISDLSAVINVPHALYADDAKLYANPLLQSSLLQSNLDRISQWCESWLLTLNSDKCKVLHLGKKNPAVQYFIDKKIITPVDSHNDLDVTITSDLSWSEHIIRTVKRANTSSYIMFKAFSRPSKTTFLKIYKSYILPLLEYANVIWSPTLIRDIKLIEKVQRRVCGMSPTTTGLGD